ncbi:putative peptide ABC transporter ATP-binding protein [Kitasatospora setae KM-6054]|uniref:Putative peptide ABC transporter ATP-binding protein n=1 Tax=Kitasatospora setae (strain ATCC 33774 / DSM 43861 / JCM 3304 / KCC A-0304 / NBRC 14216 / KM-6054) TaxID=452652 RepID=E4N5P0_KITSK|nr:putative peptide ABC transporter ATP-binding protein [Kitasatospora setae KM-6054]
MSDHPSSDRPSSDRPSSGGSAPDRPAPGGTVLEVEGLRVTVGHGAAEAVREVSFTVLAGQSVGLVGESGSGKTLTCRAVLGLAAPGVRSDAGTLALGGTDLLGLDARGWQRLRGARLGAVFQDPGSFLNPALTVGRQLAEPLRVHRGLSRADARRRAVELLDSVGLRDPEAVYGRYPHELSSGMLQRVLIAIAVSGDPDLLVADEATTALDTVVQAEVLDLLARLREERGLGLLLVSHDLAVVADATDRLLVLYAGEVVEDGPTASVVAAPAHPYTEALLAVAGLGPGARTRFPVIPGRPPAPGTAAAGCRFAPRCAYAEPECSLAPVPLVSAPDGDGDRKVRCLKPR